MRRRKIQSLPLSQSHEIHETNERRIRPKLFIQGYLISFTFCWLIVSLCSYYYFYIKEDIFYYDVNQIEPLDGIGACLLIKDDNDRLVEWYVHFI